MQATDRANFGRLAEALFAAFDKPPSDARLEAYWRGLKSMDLVAFESTVEVVIGPDGEDELPTPKQLYALDRKRRAELRAAEMAGRAPKGPAESKLDAFDCYTGQVLFAVLCKLITQHGSPATEESLAEMIHVKQFFADGYREQCKDEPEAETELRDKLIEALERRFVPREPRKEFIERQQPLVAGSTWQRALAELESTNGEHGHNAPIGSPHWRTIPPIPRP